MVKKIKKYLKFVVCCALIMSLVAPSYAALSASDGSAFVTKAEFDSALADFNARLTTFEAGINSKIDSQVTSYLDRNGIWNGANQIISEISAAKATTTGGERWLTFKNFGFPGNMYGQNSNTVVFRLNGFFDESGTRKDETRTEQSYFYIDGSTIVNAERTEIETDDVPFASWLLRYWDNCCSPQLLARTEDTTAGLSAAKYYDPNGKYKLAGGKLEGYLGKNICLIENVSKSGMVFLEAKIKTSDSGNRYGGLMDIEWPHWLVTGPKHVEAGTPNPSNTAVAAISLPEPTATCGIYAIDGMPSDLSQDPIPFDTRDKYLKATMDPFTFENFTWPELAYGFSRNPSYRGSWVLDDGEAESTVTFKGLQLTNTLPEYLQNPIKVWNWTYTPGTIIKQFFVSKGQSVWMCPELEMHGKATSTAAGVFCGDFVFTTNAIGKNNNILKFNFKAAVY